MSVSSESSMPSIMDRIIQWEADGLPEDEMIDLFQDLIDTGLAWSLQGTYGRQARSLIDAGLCHPATE